MSSRIVKALRVLDLLRNRRTVSRDSLIRETGATERTVYRLLRLLSEADVPVYYDPQTQGYKLASASPKAPLELTLQEFTLVLFAIDLLSEVVGQSYRMILSAMRDRLLSGHPYNLDCIFRDSASSTVADRAGNIDASLTSVLISAAVESSRGIEVVVDGGDGVVRRSSVAEPSLVYRSPEWLIADKCTLEVIPLSSVRAVQISVEGAVS